MVKQALGERRRSLEVRELYLLKQEFGLSIAGWTYRALDTSVISNTTHREFWKEFAKRGWKKKEPGEQYPPESPRLFEQTVYRALGEELITESRAAELLSISLANLDSRRRMEVSDAESGD